MKYRRFGKTEIRMPVLSCGGMRFQQAWKDLPASELNLEEQKRLENTVRKALSLGINHIETARGYGSSEYQLGRLLPQLPRKDMIVQTKIGPKDSEEEFLQTFETSFGNLGLEYIDLLAIHGINTAELLDKTLYRGTLKACRKLQKEGKIGHVGFATHAGPEVVIPAIECGEFSFVNMHWYYFDQKNSPAIREAARQDMGIFIISPSDKGGKLHAPSHKLKKLCKPFTPMQFNDLFCLLQGDVHTISIGAACPEDFDEHVQAVTGIDSAGETVAAVQNRLESEFESVMGRDWATSWQEGLPHMVKVPEPLPLYFILRLYNLAKTYDMTEYAKDRYNLLGSGGHWVPGQKVEKVDWNMLREALNGYSFAGRIPEMLREAHEWFDEGEKKRLSESAS